MTNASCHLTPYVMHLEGHMGYLTDDKRKKMLNGALEQDNNNVNPTTIVESTRGPQDCPSYMLNKVAKTGPSPRAMQKRKKHKKAKEVKAKR